MPDLPDYNGECILPVNNVRTFTPFTFPPSLYALATKCFNTLDLIIHFHFLLRKCPFIFTASFVFLSFVDLTLAIFLLTETSFFRIY